MTRRGVPIVCAVVAIAGGLTLYETRAGAQGGSTSSGGAARHLPTNEAEFDQVFKQVSNWGRWGKDDQRGTANLITAAKRKQAAALVKAGITVSLSHEPLTVVADDNPQPWEHVMNPGFQTDTYKVSYHGFVHSHLDALCHILYKDQTYNGYAKKDVNTDKGCLKLGIENFKEGVFTRGILIDIPRLKGVPYLENGTPVYPEDIEAWEKKVGVKVSAGDAILLRTGRWVRRAQLGPWKAQTSIAGYHASVVPWMKARDVAFVGSDGVQDVIPSGVEGVGLPVHTLLIAALGVNLLDSQDLEDLAETAARLNRWEFLLTVAPMPMRGGTGSPANTQATF